MVYSVVFSDGDFVVCGRTVIRPCLALHHLPRYRLYTNGHKENDLLVLRANAYFKVMQIENLGERGLGCVHLLKSSVFIRDLYDDLLNSLRIYLAQTCNER